MYYWGKSFTHDGTYYDWVKMHQVINKNSAPSDPDAWHLVRSLIRFLGDPSNLNMEYQSRGSSGEGSGASAENIPRTFRNCGYSNGGSWVDYNVNTLINDLSYGPAIGLGFMYRHIDVYHILGIRFTGKPYHSGGHAWIYDKDISQRKKVTVYRNTIFYREYYETRNLLHINWGNFDGTCNGYFLSSRLDFKTGLVTKGTETSGTYGYYQYNLSMVSGIRAN